MHSVTGTARAAVDWASLLLWDLNIVSQSPSRVGNGARKSVIFVLAQKCGEKVQCGFYREMTVRHFYETLSKCRP